MDFRKKYYVILGIDSTASPEEMRAAYRSLVKLYHPDRNSSPEAAEKIKEINEAYEVLSDPAKRKIYDTYQTNETGPKVAEAASSSSSSSQRSSKRTYQRRYTVQKTEKLFISGTIFIKFCAPSIDALQCFIENTYAIFPTNTKLTIHPNGIFREPPAEYILRQAKAMPLQTPLEQPILCQISGEDEPWYKLELKDIRILDPRIIDVTKHDGQSFGTLTGEIFAYVIRISDELKVETVTECYGETGRVETKQDAGAFWKRTEYYRADCTTYWSDWIKISSSNSHREGNKYRSTNVSSSFVRTSEFSGESWISIAEGCLGWLWIPLVTLFIIFVPQLLLLLLILGVLWLMIGLGQRILARGTSLFSLLLVAILAGMIAASLQSDRTSGYTPTPWAEKNRSESMPERVNIPKTTGTADSTIATGPSEYISHLIKWVSYDSMPYEVVLSARVADIHSSNQFHNALSVRSGPNAWTEVFSSLEAHDSNDLNCVYTAFDSIRKTNDLDDRQFAEIMVSAVQSIPYFLVTPSDCEAAGYNDPFVRDFLNGCKDDCCIGNTKFGIRTPLEFLSDLKGDCDTRALFLYVLLKHFGYDVALMTSEYYRHAAIAVHFKDDGVTEGSVLRINGKNYYPWETTNKGYIPGRLPEQCKDLSYWNIALVNE